MKPFFKKLVVTILEAEAKAVLKKYGPRIVAITGSVGKTTTKDAIYTVLSKSHFVRKSAKSFNSEVGVPLTILGIPNAWSNPIKWIQNIFEGFLLVLFFSEYPEWLILEVGADRPGDIEKISKWIKPDITVITKMSDVPVHVEFFDSPEALIREKSHLAVATKPDGVLILNADDTQSESFSGLTKAHVLRYGFGEKADIKASEYSVSYENLGTRFLPTGISYHLEVKDKKAHIFIAGALGVQHAYTSLAAAGVGIALGKSIVEISETLISHVTPPGRMKIIPGILGSLIIDDTYNSSPVAAKEALETLRTLETNTRKVAVLGDMLELGQFSLDEHKKIGAHAAKVVSLLVTVGVRSKATAEAAVEAGLSGDQIFSFDDSVAAGKFLRDKIKEGDIILCKGSQGIRAEKVVESIMADPKQASLLLVRQDEEWKIR